MKGLSATLIPDLPGALCRETDPETFFPELGQPSTQAKSVCNVCPVRKPCLEWALDHEERFGVWGGMSAKARGELLQKRKAALA